MMNNRCAYQHNNAFGEMRRGDSSHDGVVCPKPRRLDDHHLAPSLWLSSNRQAEVFDSRAGTELMDLILTKGCYGVEKPNTPPFFSGSPPSRASNPVIQDARFCSEKLTVAPEALPSQSARKQGSCVRANFGHKPAAVRIEGFNCSRGNCSISAVA
ncbi:hypothetical protein LguiA_009316 [Lonicera macranthoides]